MLAALLPPGVVTTTLAVPAVPAGVNAVIDVLLTTTTLAAAVPPMVTPVAPVKLVPEIVTAVPPAAGPELGTIPVTVGWAAVTPKVLLGSASSVVPEPRVVTVIGLGVSVKPVPTVFGSSPLKVASFTVAIPTAVGAVFSVRFAGVAISLEPPL